jgi:hypothetical protein
LRCLRRSTPSFDYNKDVKRKRVERQQKEAERNGNEKLSWISLRRRFPEADLKSGRLCVMKHSPIQNKQTILVGEVRNRRP